MSNSAAAALEQPQKAVSNGILGMLFLLTTEAMLFAGFISSLIVNRATDTIWPPPGQPRLPVEATFVNTLILLASGVIYAVYARKYKSSGGDKSTIKFLLAALLLGIVFVSVQGYEWMRLLGFGLTTKSNLYGAYFYMIIGAHALHVAVGITLLSYLAVFIKKGQTFGRACDKITITGMYWYFVVAIWPLLYYLVYIL
ncbi:hypothetical protein MASR2M18_14830 [Ignavibacteria bacterium]|nr:heme-copper oxidase subunit III [Bacteroidota bacterium]MCZ2133002.1 heme-copper oxidase subunit III [Bacteroidota bacterium]